MCEKGDFLALDRKIQKLSRGDYIMTLSSGAYCFAMSSHYNLRTKPIDILVKMKSIKLQEKESYLIFKYCHKEGHNVF